MKKTLLTLVFSLIFGSFALGLFAQESTPPMPNPPPPQPPMAARNNISPAPCVVSAFRLFNPLMVDVLCSKLNLDAQQKKTVLDLLTKSEEAAKPKIEAQRQAAEKFMTTMGKPDLTEAELLTAGENAMKAESDLLTEKIKAFSSLRKILTDQQKTELAKFIEGYSVMWRPRTTAPGPFQTPPQPAEPAKTN